MRPMLFAFCLLAALATAGSAAAETRLRAVGEPEIVEALRLALLARGVSGDIRIALAKRPRVLRVPRDAGLAVLNLDYAPRTSRFSARLAATGPDTDGQSFRLTGRAVPVVSMPALTRTVPAGDIIEKADIGWIEIEAGRLPRDALADLDGIVGKSARRPLPAGRLLRQRDVSTPVLVRKGTLVTMVVVAPGLQLSATGRVLENGGRGDLIRVMNIGSKRTVQAVVWSASQVRIPSRPQIAATASLQETGR